VGFKALSGKEFTQYRAGCWLRIKAERRAHNTVMSPQRQRRGEANRQTRR
jgi:hypothetical protein